jgi:hypothetical protein
MEEANEICEDFEDLKDTEFTMGTPVTYLVADVVVSPFPEQEQLAFVEHYFATKDAVGSLGLYSGSEYDVLVFVYDADNEAERTYITIRDFAAQQGIGYSFPVHQ